MLLDESQVFRGKDPSRGAQDMLKKGRHGGIWTSTLRWKRAPVSRFQLKSSTVRLGESQMFSGSGPSRNVADTLSDVSAGIWVQLGGSVPEKLLADTSRWRSVAIWPHVPGSVPANSYRNCCRGRRLACPHGQNEPPCMHAADCIPIPDMSGVAAVPSGTRRSATRLRGTAAMSGVWLSGKRQFDAYKGDFDRHCTRKDCTIAPWKKV